MPFIVMVISKLQLFLGFPPGLVIEYINKKRHVDYHFPHVFKIFLLIIGFEYNWFSLQTYSLLCTFKNSFEKGVVPAPPQAPPRIHDTRKTEPLQGAGKRATCGINVSLWEHKILHRFFTISPKLAH